MPAVSQSQQRLFGMVRAAQKGTLKNPSPEVSRIAGNISSQDAHDFAVTKHKGLPNRKQAGVAMSEPETAEDEDDAGAITPSTTGLSSEIPSTPAEFGAKLASAVKLEPRNGGSFSSTTPIGQARQPRPMPPAQQQAMQQRPVDIKVAPTVPNPIVPPHQQVPLQTIGGAKQAGCCTMKAPRYRASGKKGKKAMPRPYETRMKAAEFGASLAGDIEKQSMQEFAPEVQDPWSHAHEQIETGLQHAYNPLTNMARFAAQPFGGGGTTIGGLGGMFSAPAGHKMEGLGRGIGQGVGFDLGAMGGGFGGSQLGAMLGGMAAPTLYSMANGRPMDPDEAEGVQGAGQTAGRWLGGVAGSLGGGLLGRNVAKGMMGKPSYEKEEEEDPTKMAAHIEKQALGGLGTLIGAAGGFAGAPSGHRMEGMGRGVGQGLGWDVGGGVGAGVGAGLGGIGGGLAAPAIAQLLASSQGRTMSPEEMHSASMGGMAMGGSLGGLGGYFGGGMLGKNMAHGMMGDPTYQKDEEDPAMTAANMAAP